MRPDGLVGLHEWAEINDRMHASLSMEPVIIVGVVTWPADERNIEHLN